MRHIKEFDRTYEIPEKATDTIKIFERYHCRMSRDARPNIIVNCGDVISVVLDITKTVIETLEGQRVNDGHLISISSVCVIVPIQKVSKIHEDIKLFWQNEIEGDKE